MNDRNGSPDAGQELQRLRRRVAALEAENRRLRGRGDADDAAPAGRRRRLPEMLTALHEVGNVLSRTDHVDALCRQAIQLGRRRLGFARLGLWMRGAADGALEGTFGVDESGRLRDERGWRIEVQAGSYVEPVLRGAEPVVVQEAAPLYAADGKVVGRGPAAAAALRDRGRIIGVLVADSLLDGRPIDPIRAEVLRLYAATLGHLVARTRAEEAVRRSEALYRATIDALGDAVHVVDRNLRITLCNAKVRRWCREVGVEGDVIGRTVLEAFTFLGERERGQYEQVLRTHRPHVTEEHNTLAGRRTITETQKIPVVQDGEVVWIVTVVRDVTARRRAADALRASEQKYRALAEQINDVAYATDGQGRLSYISPQVRRYGMDPEGMLGESVLGFVVAEDRQAVAADLAETLRTGREFPTRFRIRGPDGRTRWIEDCGRVQRDAAGRIVGLTGVLRDVTDQKAAEDALRQSEARYRGLFEGSPVALLEEDFTDTFKRIDALRAEHGDGLDAYLRRDPQALRRYAEGLKVVEVNRAMLELFGARSKEELAKNFPKLFGPDTLESLREDLMAFVAGAASRQSEVAVYTVRGERIWADLKWSVLPGAPAGRRRAVLAVVDLTARHRAQQALRQSERRFRSLVGNIPGAVYRCACDEHWTMYFLSERIRELTGYPADEFLNNRVRSYESIVHPDDRDRVRRAVMEGVARRRPYVIEYRIDHADGGIRWSYERGQGVFDEAGKLLWLDGVILDVTDRKRAEQDVQAMHRQVLTARERERRRLAREMHDSVGQQIAGLHLALQGVLAGAADSPAVGRLRRICDGCETLIREVRDISYGLYPPGLESLGLVASLRQLAGGLADRAEVPVRCPKTLEAARFAPEVEIALFRIAQEAVHNALTHGRAGRVELRLRRQKGELVLAVVDDGCGFDARSAQGGGLGLIAMRERADALGGRVLIRSRPGRTRVEARVPAAPAPA
jgi:PAS domain S-box-containing protein